MSPAAYEEVPFDSGRDARAPFDDDVARAVEASLRRLAGSALLIA